MPGTKLPTTAPVLVADPDDAQAVAQKIRLAAGDVPLPPLAIAHHADELDRQACLARVLVGPPQLVATLLPRLPALRWVQSTWAGVTPILAAMQTHPNPTLTLTAAKGLFGPRMAEYVFGWLLALERRMLDYEALKGAGRWERLPWRDLAGRSLLLLGTGSIGRHLAGVAQAFGLSVRGVSRRGAPVDGIGDVLPVSRLHEALGDAHYVVASLPDTAATHRLLDARAFAAMRPEAILINVGRGTLVDDQALIDALHDQHLGAAVLDVFREEPLPPTHPFWSTPRLHLTPHVAAFTPEDGIIQLFVDNLRRYQRGEPLSGQVDRDEGY